MRVYDEFLQDIRKNDPVVRQNIIDMQYNIAGDQEVVVIDNSAMQTPLEWLAKSASRSRVVQMKDEQASVLLSLTNGKTRLALLSIGAFSMFVGFVKGPIAGRT